jgi:hypothetical protein
MESPVLLGMAPFPRPAAWIASLRPTVKLSARSRRAGQVEAWIHCDSVCRLRKPKPAAVPMEFPQSFPSR